MIGIQKASTVLRSAPLSVVVYPKEATLGDRVLRASPLGSGFPVMKSSSLTSRYKIAGDTHLQPSNLKPTPVMNQDNTPSPRVAIVSGAAQGLGEAIALQLADDGLDVAVAGSTRNPERLDAVVEAIVAKGRRAIAVTGDVSIEADVAALVEKTVEQLGGVDVVSVMEPFAILLTADHCASR